MSISGARCDNGGVETLRLAKHHGLGNDFLIALLSDEEKTALDTRHLRWPGLASSICHRRTGIGADGLLLGIGASYSEPARHEHADDEDFSLHGSARATMVLYNSDGSRAEVSGNGAACLANALAHSHERWRRAIAEPRQAHLQVTIETDAGSREVGWRHAFYRTEDGHIQPHDENVDVDMPIVVKEPDIVPALDDLIAQRFGGNPRDTGDVGNPHLVIATDGEIAESEVRELGSEYQSYFADGINVEFVWPIHDDSSSSSGASSRLGMAVYERGAGLTDACGTGAVVAAIRAREWGIVRRDIWTEVVMPGGSATVAQMGLTGYPQLQLFVEHVADIEWPLRGPWLDA